jgi:glucokinase
MTDLVAVDIGGTHARFARASVGTDGSVTIGEVRTLKTDDHVSLQTAWDTYRELEGGQLPAAAAIAIAGPVSGATVRMTNNSWSFRPNALPAQLKVDRVTVINDFGAVAHAAARAPDSEFLHLAGPDGPLPRAGTISVIGPGTGLGVAHFHRFADAHGGGYHVQPTEGGHVDFAPVDAIDDAMLLRLRKKHRRVSAERVVSGPGIAEIHAALAAYEGRAVEELDDTAIWEAGLGNAGNLAVAAVERFCQSLGSVAGDYALAHGAAGVVIAGGLGQRLRDVLPSSGFAERFRFKGRYEQMMAGIPVKLITLPQPGLYGAAAAFAKEHL